MTYELATGLLGYTPDTLLDDVVDAFAAGDGAAVFGVVDKVIETGQDPRRFTEDLLRRLRDLVIVAAVPDAPATGLIDVSEDQGERLVAQAARFGPAELSRAADIVASGLTEMRGATAPRLLLELLCARVLLPGADDATNGVLARLDRLEKRMSISGGAPTPTVAAPGPARPGPSGPARRPARRARPGRRRRPQPAAPPAPRRAGPRAPEPARRAVAEPEPAPVVARADARTASRQPRAAQPARRPRRPPAGALTLVDVRRLWPDIVEATKGMRRLAWMHLTQNCQVVAVDGDDPHARLRQRRRPRLLRERRVRRRAAPGRGRRGRRRLEDRHHRRPQRPGRGHAHRDQGRDGARGAGRSRARLREAPAPWDPQPDDRAGAGGGRRGDRRGQRRRPRGDPADPVGRRARRRSAGRTGPRPTPTPTPTTSTPSTRASSAAELLQRELGAQMIEEIPHQ